MDYYRNDGNECYLPQSEACPREIYDLMRGCWNLEPAERPTFREICMFLQRKNIGYNPKEEAMFKPKMNIQRRIQTGGPGGDNNNN